MKKKFLAMLMLVVAATVLLTVGASAEGGTVAKIGDTPYETFSDAMTAANAMTGDVVVDVYGEGEFVNGMELKGSYTSITFNGEADGAKITINQTAGGDYLEAHGKTVAFNNLTLAKANPAWAGNSGHMGNYFSIQGGTVTYTNCTFPNGACTSGGTATYNNCTFQNTSEYGLWVYDDALVTVNGGTIDSKKGIKVYSEDEVTVTSTLTVQNATFTANVTEKPAVAIGYAESITLIGNTYNNTTGVLELDSGSDADCEGVTFVAQDADGHDISSTLTAVDRSDSNADCGVLVDGKIYTTVTEAAKDAASGDIVTLLYSTTETVELPMGVTLDTNGNTAANVTVAQPVAKIGETGYTSLQAAIDAAVDGDTITLLADCAEDVIVAQKADVNLIIDGQNNEFSGTINVYGAARHTGEETLTIQNVAFTSDEASHDFIWSNSTDSDKRYAHNVTVQDCTFTATADDNSVVALRIRQGYDITVKDCEATGLHTLMQFSGCNGVMVDNVTLTGKGGINLNTAYGVTVQNSNFTVEDYAIRIGEDSPSDASAETLTITGNSLTSTGSEDAVIVVRQSSDNLNLNVSENAISGQTHIAVPEATFSGTVSADANYWDGNDSPSVSGTDVIVSSYYEDAELTTLKLKDYIIVDTYSNDKYKTINVYTAAGLQWVNEQDAAGNLSHGEGRSTTINIMGDIDMSGYDWRPLNGHWVNINGNGYTISNLDCISGTQSGFVGYGGACNITGLTLENVTASGSQVGAFMAQAEGGKLTDCTLAGEVNLTWESTSDEVKHGGAGILIGLNVSMTLNNVNIAEDAVVTVDMTGMEVVSYASSQAPYVGTSFYETEKGAVTDVTTSEQATVVVIGADGEADTDGYYTLNLNMSPADVIATVTGDGLVKISDTKYAMVDGNTYTVAASKSGYYDYSETVTAGADIELEVTLEKIPTAYRITVGDAENGTATTDYKSARAGRKVTVTVTADEKYIVKGLTVKTATGRTIAVTDNEDGTYTFTMPGAAVTITAEFGIPFTDIEEDHKFYEAIEWVYVNGLMIGKTEDTFDRASDVSRQQVWMVLGRIQGADPENMAAAKEWAMAQGITDGTRPGEAAAREEFITMMWKAFGAPEADTSVLEKFSDADAISAEAQTAMAWAVEVGITEGYGDGTMRPAATTTRGAFAAVLYRYLAK